MQARYFRPKSMTWWAGVSAIGLGVAKMAGAGEWAGQLGEVIAMLTGGADTSAAGLLTMGFGLIGVRDVLARAYEGV